MMVSMNSNEKCLKIDSNWTTKDKLYLVSSVLMNGDQNWSFISNQLSQIYEFERKQKEQQQEEDNGDDDKKSLKYSLSVSLLKRRL